jgi:aconitate hydratase
MGQSPNTKGISLRTFNRNFKGRSGTTDADVYLVSPEVAAISAIHGVITNPVGKVDEAVAGVEVAKEFKVHDNMFVAPTGEEVEVIKGPNIKPFPKTEKLKENIHKNVLIVVEDNITTDHIMPSNAKLLPYRSNIPYLSDYCLTPCDPEFPARAKEQGGGIIVAGHNYGQGSSREHAALAPLYLGIKAVIAKSFARIHKNNLINNGILPLIFKDEKDYDGLNLGDSLSLDNILVGVEAKELIVKNETTGKEIKVVLDITDRQKEMIFAGGLINMMKENK